MNYYKLRIAAIAISAGSVIIPPTLYKASEVYIQIFNAGCESWRNIKAEGLQLVNLAEIKPTASVDNLITEAALKYKLPPKLLSALIHSESRQNSDAFSPKGAIGLSQIMAANAKRCGLDKASRLWDDRVNVMCGAQILSEELTASKGKLNQALQTYNGGPRCKNKCAESIQYANLVTARFAQSSLQ